MKTILNLIICTGTILLSGCQLSNQTLPDNLIGNKWILIKVVHTDTNIEESVPGNLANMNIEFNNTFKIHAMGACNSIDGDYSISGDDSIKVKNLGRTKIYCDNEIEMSWEDTFYHNLKNATNFDISGDILKIKSASNITMIFKQNLKN